MLRAVTRTQVVLHERKLCYIAPGFISKKNNYGKTFQNDITVQKNGIICRSRLAESLVE